MLTSKRTWKQWYAPVAFVLGMFCFCLASRAPADDFEIERHGSILNISWGSSHAGTWELRTSQGRICDFGAVAAGANRINLQKITSAEDLVLNVETSAGGVPSRAAVAIPGKPVFSPLNKPTGPAVIYQLQPRTYLASGLGETHAGKIADLSDAQLTAIKDLGVDYIWLTGVLEHANRKIIDPDVVKGDAGSYYAIYDNWDVAEQAGTLADIEGFIERAHKAGLRVLIDFVANHTARLHRTDVKCKQELDFGRGDRTDQPFHPENNYYYVESQREFTPPYQPDASDVDGIFDADRLSPGIQYELPAKVTGNNVKNANPSLSDWYETVRLNYGYDIFTGRSHYQPVPKTWWQMVDIATYWVSKGVDGFRVDFSHAVPIEFWRFFARQVRQVFPSAFLLAEAYEEDNMILPGFSYQALFAAGFDSIYNAKMYWNLRHQAEGAANIGQSGFNRTPAARDAILADGHLFTHFMENHDEVRLAARQFSPILDSRAARAEAGLAYSTYAALLPGFFLLHGGQELQEDAGVFGNFDDDNGRTSIFDYVYQQYTKMWVSGEAPAWMTTFRRQYQELLQLRRQPPFNSRHAHASPSFLDVSEVQAWQTQNQWLSAYLRYTADSAYLVVMNADPKAAHETVIHFTSVTGADSHGALAAMKVENSERRYLFVEVLQRQGWTPMDPNIAGPGHPGWVLYKAGNVPSGLYLGPVPAATTYVFKIVPL